MCSLSYYTRSILAYAIIRMLLYVCYLITCMLAYASPLYLPYATIYMLPYYLYPTLLSYPVYQFTKLFSVLLSILIYYIY